MNQVIAIVGVAAGLLFAEAASAAPPLDLESLPGNGALSRTHWTPDVGRQELMGLRWSAGVAVGLRDLAQAHLGRRVSPTVSLELGPASRLSFVPGDRGSRLLVLHTTN